MRTSISRTIWILIGLGLFLLSLPTLVWAREAPIENVIEMDVQYGFRNQVKTVSFVPVKVEVSCISGSVSGKVRIEIPVQSEGNLNASIWMSDIDGRNNKEQCYVWEKEIILAQGESAEEIFYIELPMYESYFNVSVISEEKIIGFKEIFCDYTENRSRLWMGVVSENSAEINQLNGMQISEDTYLGDEIFLKTISLDSEDIYENPLALEQLDILIVDKGTSFTKAQKMAIDIWKNNGGLYYERETESLLELVSYFKTGEYAETFESVLSEIGIYHSYSKDFDNIPLKENISIGRYIFLIVLYLVVVGPGLYWLLRGKKEPFWLLGSVCVVSVLFIFLIYLTGRSINMSAPAICHETLYEQNGDYMKTSVDFSVQAYQMQNFEFVLDGNYQIFPKRMGMDGAKSVDMQMAETITFENNDNQNTVLLQNMSAYRQNCFFMEQYKVLPENDKITFQISGNGEALQIHWDNPTSYAMKQALVVFKNRIAILGEIKPYAQGSVEHAVLYAYGDDGMSLLLEDLLDFSEYTFPEYEIENLTNVIWENLYNTNNQEETPFVIGILENAPNIFGDNIGFHVYGTSLLKIDVEINWIQNQICWCPNLEVYGTAYSGEFNEYMNLLDSKEAIVDYPTSQVGKLLSLEFFNLDYSRQEYYIPFDGKIYLFNWQIGMFTEVMFWQHIPYDILLEPYISDTGILRVYYVMDERFVNANRSCVLPCIKISGKVE